jgi:cysteine-rich repeat protein
MMNRNRFHLPSPARLWLQPGRLWLVPAAAALIALMFLGHSRAYERYNDGCQDCHGSFTSATTQKSPPPTFPSGDKHEMHRASSSMNADCDLCHTQGDGRDPFIGSSNGTNSNPGLGCTGCHNELGLRLHHLNRGVNDCQGCHSSDPTPPGEDTLPVYYGVGADSDVDNPCNTVAQANINENWTIGDLLGLDNDGDLLYDQNDPDCGGGQTCGNNIVEGTEECDDGNTLDGDCCSSTCAFESSGSPCNNGLFCTVGEACDGAGTCGGGAPRDCDDGIGCTVDSCNEGTDSCVNTPDDTACDDGLFCNGAETCDATQDCQAGTPVDCDDADICTDDSCDEATDSCDNIFDPGNDPSCAAGTCGNGQVEAGEECDDGNTLDGDCCSSTCQFEPIGSTCDDGLFCTVDEACDGAGTCGGGNPRDCSDGVGCTADTCNETTDTCVNLPTDAVCDDGVFCNGMEICDPAQDCQPGTPVDCDDADICTDDSCNEAESRCDNIFNAGNAPECAEQCPDLDGDSFSTAGGSCGEVDCDDDDPGVNPGTAEVCDDYKDNDCNGFVDVADPACEATDEWQVRSGPLQDPAYAGSEACGRCHGAQFETWKDSLHARMQIPPGDAQAAGFPLPDALTIPGAGVTLESWNDVLFVLGQKWRTHYVDRGGNIQNIRWTFQTGRWDPLGGGPYDCGACHTTGYDADAIYMDDQGRPVTGITGSWVEFSVGCEACHGPGAEHAAVPTKQNINRIELDWTNTGEGIRTPAIRSSEVCGNCHYYYQNGTGRRYGIADPARRNHEQFNDWSAGPHGLSLQNTATNTYCAQCHSPGNADPAAEEQFFNYFQAADATLVACISCHDPHRISQDRWATLEWPAQGIQNPKRYQAALARYLGSDGDAFTSDFLPFASDRKNDLCVDCHKRQPGFRRHLDVSPKEAIDLAPPFNNGEPFIVPHGEHVEEGYADCADCHMAYSRTSAVPDDIRTHSFQPNEWDLGGFLHYDETCGQCHSQATQCRWCHQEFGGGNPTAAERVRPPSRMEIRDFPSPTIRDRTRGLERTPRDSPR